MKAGRPALLLLTAGGLGFMKPASGTWGSTPPPALALVLVGVLGRDGITRGDLLIVDATLVAVALVFSWACVKYGGVAETLFGRKDPGQVVADEVAGQAIVLLALPWRAFADAPSAAWNLALAATAFLAFRLCDIVKPPPANGLQRLRGGWGILVDDLVAGVYAIVVTQLIVRLALPLAL